MHKRKLIFAVFVCVLVVLQLVSAQKLTIAEDKKYFALPEENGTIILLEGTSYEQEGVYYGAGNYSVGRIYSRYFPMFSIGNGTDDVRISAHNCNVTITSFNSQENTIENASLWYIVYMSSWFNYTISGNGSQSVDCFSFVKQNENNPPFLNGNTTVYIDGTLKQQGDGWNWTDFVLNIVGAISRVSIFSQATTWEPFRNPPHLSPYSFAIGITVIVLVTALIVAAIVVTLLWVERHSHRQCQISSQLLFKNKNMFQTS